MKNIILITIIFSSLYSNAQIKDVLVPYRKSNQWGFSDSNGKIIIEPVYDSVSLYEVVYAQKKRQFVKYSKVFKDKKVGLLSENNIFLIPLNYTQIISESESERFIVKNSESKFGLIDFDKTIIPIEYDKIKATINNSYVVEKNKKIGLLDNDGKIVIPLIYDQFYYVSNENGQCKWKVVNSQETKYVYTSEFKDENEISIDHTIGGSDFKEVDFQPLDDNFFKKYGWIKKHPKYEYAIIFSQKDKYGFLNAISKNTFTGKSSKLDFFEEYFDERYHCKHFILKIKEDKKEGIIDESGKILVPILYDKIYMETRNCYVELNKFKGLYFPKTNIFIEPKFKGIPTYKEFWDDFKIFEVYEDSQKNWYYIGNNGVIFKE